ncbi:aminopeptidase [Mobilisporobacter senegalensis]|uniref:aminopeptidase n=1 Tax=Mobilisporobacter senegalensis TaxID=1329262 RepID=UPI000F476EB9|nr:aminopeptidase [Mobilisporobacter senegalensis]
MDYKILFKEQNEEIKERYELAMNRVADIINEDSVKEPFKDYFEKVASFILQIKELVEMVESSQLAKKSMNELKVLNESLYEDIILENYNVSYANPEYSMKTLGEKYAKLLSFLYAEIRGMIPYAYESRLFDITIYLELFVEIYNYFEEENEHTYKDVKSAIYYFVSDYSEITVKYRIREALDPELSFATDIIMNEDLTDLRYLYSFGEYITENEIAIATYLNNLDESAIEAMAKTYVEGFRKGFELARIDLSKKTTVNIRYSVGFERIVRVAIKEFERLNLKPVIYRAAVASIHKNQHHKIGYYSTSPNKQYDYDHRFDDAIYLDKAFTEQKLVYLRKAYDEYKELAKGYAGPAVMETFGERPFAPINKPEAAKLEDKQQKLAVNYRRDASLIIEDYIKSSEYSFTIIAYPIPEIGEYFEEIFNETVKINTLDYQMYKEIQQSIIDALDQGEYVHILGSGKNMTDIKVKLHELQNPEKESNFENCLADVNIPVGEVFTSPMLTGTNGILHVSKVYLNELEYKELYLTFEDGKIKEYTCGNFGDEEANRNFVKENLMYNRDTLPLGEFAIGTNTTAYVMARKYDIADKLPILIAEKTGPHFAVGDTCYRMSEENKIYNPDGKEIVAKDNECSILRKTEIEKAYFNCHTDITIPYDELGEISVYNHNGDKTVIIKDGKFVLTGTERLNEVFENA